jgi:hypothetical protein
MLALDINESFWGFSCNAAFFVVSFIHGSIVTRQCLLHPPPLVWIQPESSLTDSGFFLSVSAERFDAIERLGIQSKAVRNSADSDCSFTKILREHHEDLFGQTG